VLLCLSGAAPAGVLDAKVLEAAQHGDGECLRELLGRGANPDAQNVQGQAGGRKGFAGQALIIGSRGLQFSLL
jgi:hypothetical protein